MEFCLVLWTQSSSPVAYYRAVNKPKSSLGTHTKYPRPAYAVPHDSKPAATAGRPIRVSNEAHQAQSRQDSGHEEIASDFAKKV